MKVKMFKDGWTDSLENSINKWIEDNEVTIEVRDIRMKITSHNNYVAYILYDEKPMLQEYNVVSSGHPFYMPNNACELH